MAIGISMIMLDSDAPISASDVVQHLGENWPDIPAASEVTSEEGTLSFQLGDVGVVMAKMPGPIPWSELEGPCATSILWENAEPEVKKHLLHWIVTVNGELDPIPLSTRLTQVTAATMAACDQAIGVYWGSATLIVPKSMFIDFAKEVLPYGPPLHIWVDFRVGKDSNSTSSGFTAGMNALGHMEIETQSCPEPPADLHERLMGLAGYVVENGPIIRDGDTIGEDANERIRVVYSDSLFGHEEKVMRLIYESPSEKKPWWKLW